MGSSGKLDTFRSLANRSLELLKHFELVNLVSRVFGDQTQLSSETDGIPTLQNLIMKQVRKWPKIAFNAISAIPVFLERAHHWMSSNETFQRQCKLLGDTDEIGYIWYSFPECYSNGERPILFILDAHHLFVNSRTLVCTKGIPQRGIKRQAWLRVAQSANTDLSLPMVEDVIDKQSNALAKITYSKEVEDEMLKSNFHTEAEFCKLMLSNE